MAVKCATEWTFKYGSQRGRQQTKEDGQLTGIDGTRDFFLNYY